MTKSGSNAFHGDAFLYYLLPDLPPATHYIEMDPGVANAAANAPSLLHVHEVPGLVHEAS